MENKRQDQVNEIIGIYMKSFKKCYMSRWKESRKNRFVGFILLLRPQCLRDLKQRFKGWQLRDFTGNAKKKKINNNDSFKNKKSSKHIRSLSCNKVVYEFEWLKGEQEVMKITQVANEKQNRSVYAYSEMKKQFLRIYIS